MHGVTMKFTSVSYKVKRVLITRNHENTGQYFTENSTNSKARQNRRSSGIMKKWKFMKRLLH